MILIMRMMMVEPMENVVEMRISSEKMAIIFLVWSYNIISRFGNGKSLELFIFEDSKYW